MSGRRGVAGLSALAGLGVVGLLCCAAIPAVLGAVVGSAIGGPPGVIVAAAIAIVVGLALLRRRAARGSNC